MASIRLVIPLLNQKVETIDLPVWNLAPNVSLAKEIPDEDFLVLMRGDAEEIYRPMLNSKTTCICIDDFPEPNATSISQIATCIRYCLNTFAGGSPIAIPNVAVIRKDGANRKFQENIVVQEISHTHGLQQNPFAFKPSTEADAVSKLFELVTTVSRKHSEVDVTLTRFNSCLVRPAAYDKLIDATISLESLIASTTELRFKFALFNSFIAEAEPSKRAAAFLFLQVLYDARSSIVHGSSNVKSNAKKIQEVTEKFPEVTRLALNAINYYLFYLYEERSTKWGDHLEGLVLGVERRITD